MGAKLQTGGSDDDDSDNFGPVAEINMTPLVDVMLVLLIIFMVAAPLMITGVPVNLPQNAAAKQNPPPKPLVVTYALDSSIYIRDAKVARSDLLTRLKDLKITEGDVVAYVRADRVIPYGDVMNVLSIVGAAGFSKISLLSQPTKGAGENATH